MLIKKNSIQNLIESIPLPEHLKRDLDLKRSGSNWLGLCPFHQDSTPSFYVYPKNYHCFACSAHGSVVDYEMHKSGGSFKETVERLAQTYQYALDYETNELEDKKNKSLQIQKDQIEVLKKLQRLFDTIVQEENIFVDNPMLIEMKKYFPDLCYLNKFILSEKTFSSHEMQIIKFLHYSSNNFRDEFILGKDETNKIVLPLLKENGTIYGFVFIKDFYCQIPRVFFITIHKNLIPCLNWNNARPHALKEKQLIITFDIFDSLFFYEKNINNVVICINEIDINLLKIFARRVRKLILIIPAHQEGRLFLWHTFQNSINCEDISIDVIITQAERASRESFFSSLSQEKMKIWLQNSEKISLSVTQLFLDSLPKNTNKLESFKQKILPIINRINEPSSKKALLVDIAQRHFYSSDIMDTKSAIIFAKQDFKSVKKFAESQKENSAPPMRLSPMPHSSLHMEAERVALDPVAKLRNDNDLIELTSRTAEFYHKYLLCTKANKEQIDYLRSRGLTEEDTKRWKIGYCPFSNELSKKAQLGLVSQEDLSLLGLIKKTKQGNNYYDFFHDRIIIPIPNHKGEFVGLAGRIFHSGKDTSAHLNIPKYINSPESEIFSKSKILFNYYRAVESIIIHKYVIVVEGYMDCISLVNSGIDNVVAVMGTALTKFHLEELSSLAKRVVLCFDNDIAGQSAAKRTFVASSNFQSLELEYLALPGCKDPDEYIKRFGKAEFLNLTKNKNTLLYEKICEWCHIRSKDYQDFIMNIQNEFECLIEADNEMLVKQVTNYIQDKFNISLNSFFTKGSISKNLKDSTITVPNKLSIPQLNFDWPVKNSLEIKLLLAFLHLKFSELPTRLQNIMLNLLGTNENDEKICAQAIENQFSKTGFRVFLEISSWMLENRHISITYIGSEVLELFSEEAQILIGYCISDVKVLMRFHLQELVKDSLSSGISMVLSQNVWNLKNSGFLKFLLRNIKLAFQNGVLPNLFAETLLNLEVDYIDSTLKACSSLHFDNDLDAQFQFFVSERTRRKTQLGSLSPN